MASAAASWSTSSAARRQGQPALGVGQRVVEQPGQPCGPGRDRQQLDVVGHLGQPGLGQLQRLVRRAQRQRLAGPQTGLGHHVVEPARAPGVVASATWSRLPAARRASSAASCSRRRSRPSSPDSTPRGPARGGTRTRRGRPPPAGPGRPPPAAGRSGRAPTAPVTAASRSNVTRRPSTAAALTISCTSGSRSSSSDRTSSDTVHGSGASRRWAPGRWSWPPAPRGRTGSRPCACAARRPPGTRAPPRRPRRGSC